MNKDQKPNIILMMAIGLTALLVMQYLLPEPTPPAAPASSGHVDRGDVPRTASAGSSQGDTETVRDFQPQGDYQITVTVGEAGINAHGYEAIFSSIGGGLVNYRLLGYFRVPGDPSPENRMLLFDRLSSGHDSLRVDSVTYGTSRDGLRTTDMRDARYEILEVPAGAVVEPELPEEVVRGENLVFRTVAGDWEVIRTYRFADATRADFTIPFDMSWRNLADDSRLLNYSLVGPAGMIADDDSSQFGIINFLTGRQPSASSSTLEIERKALNELISVRNMTDRDNRANVAMIGAKNRFFTAIVTSGDETLVDANGATRMLYAADPVYFGSLPDDILDNLKHQPTVSTAAGNVPVFEEVSLAVEPGMVAAGGSYAASYLLYAGPAVDSFMADADPRLEGVVSYTISYLDFISRWLVRLLTFLDGILGNYGLAIIAVTIIIKLLLHPLNRKSFISMNKMSKLAPMMKEIQKKYANDRQKMQVEMNKFYKEHGVSMAGGCLPMFIQLPIFFALYGAFSQGFSMRHAAFLPPWIKDLSKPDSIYDLGFTIPILNSSHISLLPVLYFVLQYIQMSLQPKPSDPQQAQQQKIMKFMPLMFVFIFYAMPAGLVLYFTISALCGVAENAYMRKIVLPKLGLGDSPAAAEAAAASTGAGTGAAVVPSHEGKKKKKKK